MLQNDSAQPQVKPGKVAEQFQGAGGNSTFGKTARKPQRKSEGSSSSCRELAARLGEASDTLVWKFLLCTCRKKTCECPPEHKIKSEGINPQQAAAFCAACVWFCPSHGLQESKTRCRGGAKVGQVLFSAPQLGPCWVGMGGEFPELGRQLLGAEAVNVLPGPAAWPEIARLGGRGLRTKVVCVKC